MSPYYDYVENDNLPELDESANLKGLSKDYVLQSFLDMCKNQGLDDVTVRAAAVYDRKGYATKRPLGNPLNPSYASEYDPYIVQVAVLIEPDNENYDVLNSVDNSIGNSKKMEELAEKKRKLDEARLAFEQAQQDLEDAQRSI